MGKRKRSDNESIDSLVKIVKKLAKKKRKRQISSSSSDDGDSRPNVMEIPATSDNLASDLEPQEEIPITEGTPLCDELFPHEDLELEPEILELLGSDPTEQKSYGEDLHKDLATRWQHILQNGLPKEEKVDLLKKYLPAENCSYMKAPLLNPEVKSALTEINTKKDSFSEQKQNQMSSCISAVGKALNMALTENIPHDIIKTLSDAGRLLCDTHYRESISRRYTLLNAISKQKRDMLKTTKIDNFLFGSNLSEHLKANKAITSSAAELRPSHDKTNQIQRQQRYPRTLNVRGTPRAAAAEPRVFPPPARRAPATRTAAREPRAPPPPPPAPRLRPTYPTTTRRR